MDAATGASVRIAESADGATVSSLVKVMPAVPGIAVMKAGEPKEGTGHHHLIVDGGGIEKRTVAPRNATHLHDGSRQTEAMPALSPGTHTITAQFADGLHRCYGESMQDTVTITVQWKWSQELHRKGSVMSSEARHLLFSQ